MSLLQTICAWTGLSLVVIGSILAGHSLYRTWTKHGVGPLWPFIINTWNQVRGFLARYIPFLREHITLECHDGVVSMSSVGSVNLRGRVGIRGDAGIEEKVNFLMRQIDILQNELIEDSKKFAAEIGVLREEIREARRLSKEQETSLRELSRLIAVGEVRQQLLALFLISIGTILLAVPTLYPN
jgi:hypothetical protein